MKKENILKKNFEFQEIINSKYSVTPLLINGGWLEVDTIDDHKIYSELYSKNQLNDFIMIDKL